MWGHNQISHFFQNFIEMAETMSIEEMQKLHDEIKANMTKMRKANKGLSPEFSSSQEKIQKLSTRRIGLNESIHDPASRQYGGYSSYAPSHWFRHRQVRWRRRIRE